MLSKKILTASLKGRHTHQVSQQLLASLRAAQFSGCGTGCGSTKKKSLTKFSDYQQKDVMAPMPTELA
jgi:hypothetical protein